MGEEDPELSGVSMANVTRMKRWGRRTRKQRTSYVYKETALELAVQDELLAHDEVLAMGRECLC